MAVHWSWPALVLDTDNLRELERASREARALANAALPALGVDLVGAGGSPATSRR